MHVINHPANVLFVDGQLPRDSSERVPISVDEPHILKLYLDQYNTDHEPLSIPMTHIFVVLCHV